MFSGFMSAFGLIEMVIGESVIIGLSGRVSLSTVGNDFCRLVAHWRSAVSSSGEGMEWDALLLTAAVLGLAGLGSGNDALIMPRA